MQQLTKLERGGITNTVLSLLLFRTSLNLRQLSGWTSSTFLMFLARLAAGSTNVQQS